MTFGKTTIRQNWISAKRRFDEMTFRENDVAPKIGDRQFGCIWRNTFFQKVEYRFCDTLIFSKKQIIPKWSIFFFNVDCLVLYMFNVSLHNRSYRIVLFFSSLNLAREIKTLSVPKCNADATLVASKLT